MTTPNPPRILISACLLGAPVRYDGRGKMLSHPALAGWQKRGLLVPLCPEFLGGLPTPRAPAEIEPGATAQDVLNGNARVLTNGGDAVTDAFVAGAHHALRIAQDRGCGFALLTDGSPSCGVMQVHDGHHAGRRQPGMGITAAVLTRHGIQVFVSHQIDALAHALTD